MQVAELTAGKLVNRGTVVANPFFVKLASRRAVGGWPQLHLPRFLRARTGFDLQHNIPILTPSEQLGQVGLRTELFAINMRDHFTRFQPALRAFSGAIGNEIANAKSGPF